MAKYILQKDLPDVKAGAEGVINEIGVLCFYESLGTPEYFFPKGSYENKPEWFKLKEEKIKVEIFSYEGEGKHSFTTDIDRNLIDYDYVIGIAIENIVNGKEPTYEKKYTEEDMRHCWDVCKKIFIGQSASMSVDDFIKILNK